MVVPFDIDESASSTMDDTKVNSCSGSKNLRKWCLILLAIFLLFLAIIFSVLITWAHFSANATRQALARQTLSALEMPPNGTYGRSIVPKSLPGSCLDYKDITDATSHKKKRIIFVDQDPAQCTGWIRQLWSMDGAGVFYWEVGSSCSAAHPILGCSRKSRTRYWITEYKMDFNKNKVYFTIRTEAESLCLTLCPLCTSENIILITLEQCTGDDEQLFHLANVNYEKTFARLYFPLLVRMFGL